MSYKKVILFSIIIIVFGYFVISNLITRPKETLLYYLWLILFCVTIYLWYFFHNKAISKSKISWAKYSDLRKIRNTIKLLGIIILIVSPINFLNLGYFEGYLKGLGNEESFRIPSIMRLSVIIFPYIVYCDYIFIKGNSNALFHVRSLLMTLLLPFIIFIGYLVHLFYQDELLLDFSNKYVLLSFVVFPFLLACVVKLILITYGINANEVFLKKERKINILDLFICFFLYYGSIGLCFGDISFVENLILKQAKIETSNRIIFHKILEQKVPIEQETNRPVATFHPQNATIVDSEGSHNFDSYDSPNMNVVDIDNSVKAAWGGIEIILSQTTSNEDTYYASGETSRGKVTLTAYRSSRSGEIYLVTAQMPNPSPDVKFITINFKP